MDVENRHNLPGNSFATISNSYYLQILRFWNPEIFADISKKQLFVKKNNDSHVN